MSDFDDLTLKQVIDLGNKIGGQERAKRFMSGELVLVDKTQQVSVDGVTYASCINVEVFLADWTLFYEEVFGMEVDLSPIPLPPFRTGLSWGVAVLKGLTKQQAFEKAKELFTTWKYYTNDSLDTVVPKENDERTADNGSYIVWCHDGVEADEKHKNKSANDIKVANIKTMTLLERILLELWFYWKTKSHLDRKNITLCAGSRDYDDGVPRADWRDDRKFYVDWWNVSEGHGTLRVREVVSL